MTELFPADEASPASDEPCRVGRATSWKRAIVFTCCFLGMLGTGVASALYFSSKQPLVSVAFALLADTCAVTLYTFSSNRGGNVSFMFSCPVVREQLPRLLRRHIGFLMALTILVWLGIEVQPHLSPTWTTPHGKDPSYFAVVLIVLMGGLVLGQIFSNRAALEAAHLPLAN